MGLGCPQAQIDREKNNQRARGKEAKGHAEVARDSAELIGQKKVRVIEIAAQVATREE